RFGTRGGKPRVIEDQCSGALRQIRFIFGLLPFDTRREAMLNSAIETKRWRATSRACAIGTIIALLGFAATTAQAGPAAASIAPKKVIIDTDPGTDDAVAFMLALNSPELD